MMPLWVAILLVWGGFVVLLAVVVTVSVWLRDWRWRRRQRQRIGWYT
jgi:hypothetical protein